MSADLYTDRDGDVWAVRSRDSHAVCVVLRGEIADDRMGFDTALFSLPYVRREYGPLRRLEVAAEAAPAPSLADVLDGVRQRLEDARIDAGCSDAESDKYAVFETLANIFDDAVSHAEGEAKP